MTAEPLPGLDTGMHFVHDDAQAATVIRHLLDALSHGTVDFSNPAGVAAYEKMFASGGTDVRARPRAAIEQFVAGLDVVEPGIVPVGDWRPDDPAAARPVSDDLQIYGVVGRKP